MTAYLFPGQGSQTKGMGLGLFETFPELTEIADALLGCSLKTLCCEDPLSQLNETQYTQPALYVVNALSYFKKIQSTAVRPHFFAGHSLGEYNALLASGVFDFATGLKLVIKRGELMSQVTQGAMVAIVGLKKETIQIILQQHQLKDIAIANENSHTQLVLSGNKMAIDQVMPLCEQQGALMVVPLKVSGAFHSVFMKPAQDAFAEYVKQFHFSTPHVPVISNVTARPYETNEIAKSLISQISSPVRWTETIEYLLLQGVNEFEEIGPGSVLNGLIKRIKNGQ